MHGTLLSYPLKEYREMKMQVLDDFCIKITPEIKRELNNRNSEIEIDHYCHDLIKKWLGCD